MRKLVLAFSLIFAFVFIGCAGVCVAKEVKEVKECKNPIKINNKIYCEE